MKTYIYTFFLLFVSLISNGQTVSISTTLGGTCIGASKTYSATVNGYTGTPGCINYNWTVSGNGVIDSGISTNTIDVTWSSGTSGTVSVSVYADGGLLEEEDGPGDPGDCTFLSASDTENVTISAAVTGGLTASASSTLLCSSSQVTLTAYPTGAAVSGWDGWYNSSNLKISSGSNLTVDVNLVGTYTAKATISSACNTEIKTASVTINGPVTYNTGTVVGNRTVYIGKEASGEIRVIGSNALIDRWERKIGNGSWTTYQTVTSGSESVLVLSYEDMVFSDPTTKFRAHVKKQCANLPATYLPAATISAIEYIPDYNSITTINYTQSSGSEVVAGKSSKYFDNSGKLLQSQWVNLDAGGSVEVMASEPLVDKYNRPVGQTLSAPINRGTLGFKEAFITANNGEPYTFDKFEGITPVPLDNNTPGTLGHFYSNLSPEERVPETNLPFSVSNFYEDGSGESKSASMPGDFHHLESDRVGVGKTLPIFDGELRFYKEIRNLVVKQNVAPSKVLKQVGIDANNRQVITYSDGANTIATAVGNSGTTYDVTRSLPTGEKTEFHLTTAISTGHTYHDLVNDQPVTGSIPEGFYSFTNTGGPISFLVSLDYSDFSYNFYDNSGRLVASMTPRGTEAVIANGGVSVADGASTNYTETTLPFTTLYEYDNQGRLLKMIEPDAGTTRYIYRRDGQIRFSQSAEQNAASNNRFSYTVYDELGRPIESGEYDRSGGTVNFMTMFNNTTGNETLINQSGAGTWLTSGYVNDWIKTHYDVSVTQPGVPVGISSRIGDQEFVMGAVSSTESDNVQSWYSYDEQGRVTWFLQHFKTLSTQLQGVNPASPEVYFLIEYTYDFLGNVTMVAFQPQTEENTVSEAFYHHYEYDQNQRLSKVETSIKEAGDRYLQAEYSYYLHGPLKRIELATDLQGIDYTYTVQGWLKAINHPEAGKDPGGDGITGEPNSGFSKDAFGMTLEYFQGDYSRSGVPIASLGLPGEFEQQDNGNIRSAVFPGAGNGEYVISGQSNDYESNTYDPAETTIYAKNSITLKPGFNTNGGNFHAAIANYTLNDANNLEAYAYKYDHKYQLTEAKFGKSNNMAAADNAYDVAIKSDDQNKGPYDANGNIQGIKRYGDDPNDLKNDFEFHYKAGSNQLESVDDYITSMTYDDNGQVISIDYVDPDQKDITIEYDVTGKVTKVTESGTSNVLIQFAYDDRGYRLMKQVGAAQEWYIRDASGQVMAIYNGKDNEAKIAQIELPIYGAGKLGMAFKNPDHYKYIYELTDHLGSVRAIVTKLGLQATASMETDTDPNGIDEYEAQYFDNLGTRTQLQSANSYNDPSVPGRSALTNPSQAVGPTTTLRVKAGDEISLDVYVKYSTAGLTGATIGGIADLVDNHVNSDAVGVEGGGLTSSVTSLLPGLIAGVSGNSNEPKAYLQYILLDENFALETSGAVPVTGVGDANGWEHLVLSASATEDGYLFAYVVNESNINVYFDEFTFSLLGTRVIRKTDYYPFGAVAKVWNNPDQTQQEKYRHGYQGEYSEMDTTTGWNSFELRMYDPLIGRWLQVDPMGQYASSYNGMGNNPMNGVDPDGGFVCDDCPRNGQYDDYINSNIVYSYSPEVGVYQYLGEVTIWGNGIEAAVRQGRRRFAREGLPVILGAPLAIIAGAEVGAVALANIGRQTLMNYGRNVLKNTAFEFSSQMIAQGGDVEQAISEFDVFDVVTGTRFSKNLGAAVLAGAVDIKADGKVEVFGAQYVGLGDYHKGLAKFVIDAGLQGSVGGVSNNLPLGGEATLEILGGAVGETMGNFFGTFNNN
ncbi:MAG: RHS repeat-associated core domain-containing protein [Cyclobacteriaceae bacterium]